MELLKLGYRCKNSAFYVELLRCSTPTHAPQVSISLDRLILRTCPALVIYFLNVLLYFVKRFKMIFKLKNIDALHPWPKRQGFMRGMSD